MTVNELVKKLNRLQDLGDGELEALLVVDCDSYPIQFVEDTGDGDFVEIATETPEYAELRKRNS